MYLTTANTSNASNFRFSIPSYINPESSKNPLKQKTKVVVFAGNWNQMELKFDKLIDENPKLTLAKIKDRKSNPEHEKGRKPKQPLAKTPNVILWKSTTFDDDDETNVLSSLSLKPNLSLQTGKQDDKERFSHMVLVKNLEPLMNNNEVELTINIKESTCQTETVDQAHEDHKCSRNPDSTSEMGKVAATVFDQSQESSDVTTDSVSEPSPDATLQGRPERSLGQPVTEMFGIGGRNTKVENLIPYFVTRENSLQGMFLKDGEDTDWKRAQDMIKTTGRGEVELISCSTRGFVVSFGSLIGFLPYRYLATKWKFLAFESWLKNKGLDPATYRKKLGVVGIFDASSVDLEKIEGEISPPMELEDLLAIYNREKLEYLSTFVGQKIKVNVILADRESRKLIFSVKPKEQEESIQRKRNLMAKLKVGHIVTCCIKKISYFGIFVEIEGVPALIHQTEVSWDATSNATSSFKIGQMVEAKVHQLDFSLERIYLSLKEITPDPLTESLEAVIGHNAVSDGTLDTKQPENKWTDLELLVKGLQRYEGIESVTKGRFFMSPGLTPTFQVYMASMFQNEYKLLARAGNKVQEVMVQTWLDTEEMKHAILLYNKRIE